MRVLLVSANTEKINMPTVPWGLGCVAAAARRAGHAVRLVDLMGGAEPEAALAAAIAEAEPEVIGISVRNVDDQNARQPAFLLEKVRRVVAACRAASAAPVVLGGAGYSIFPEAALEYLQADLGIVGEGEQAFCDLLAALQRGESDPVVPGLFVRGRGERLPRRFASPLDGLPLPGDDLLASCRTAGADLWLPVQTRRGCPLDCSYCSTPAIEGRRIRRRAPEPVADWMARWAEQGFGRFYVVDNNFNLPRDQALALCRAVAERAPGVRLRGILNPLGVDEPLVAAMARAGFCEVSLGFEAGNERMLHALGKPFDLRQVQRASRLLAEHGIRRMGFLLLGGPGETRASAAESLDFVAALGLDAVRATTGIRIYPNTPLHATALDQGVVDPEDDLLQPRFYLSPELAPNLDATVASWKVRYPDWIF